MRLTKQLILASQSPRRIELLTRLGFNFQVHPSDVEEEFAPDTRPEVVAVDLAGQKADQVALFHPDALVLAADTIVVLQDRILGKPSDDREAHQMLSFLSGRQHHVITGIALSAPSLNRRITVHERTYVTFDTLTNAEIEAYVATGSPLDKAGAYGIQDDLGALFVRKISGDYYNVVGLPLNLFYRSLKRYFADLLISIT